MFLVHEFHPIQFNSISRHVLRADEELLAALADVLQVLVAAAGLAHVEGVLAGLGEAGGVVAVVVDDAAEDRVPVYIFKQCVSISPSLYCLTQTEKGKGECAPHPLVHVDGDLVPCAHVQVDEPGVVAVRRALQALGQAAGEAEAAPGGRDGQDGDVAVPGGVVRRAAHRGGLFFEFAHDCWQGKSGLVCFISFSVIDKGENKTYCIPRYGRRGSRPR